MKSKSLAKQQINALVGRNIRREREACRLTREELSEMIDITSSHMGLIERGDRGATAITLTKLSNTLCVPVDYFFNSPKEEGASIENYAYSPLLRKLIGTAQGMEDTDLQLLMVMANGIKDIYHNTCNNS